MMIFMIMKKPKSIITSIIEIESKEKPYSQNREQGFYRIYLCFSFPLKMQGEVAKTTFLTEGIFC